MICGMGVSTCLNDDFRGGKEVCTFSGGGMSSDDALAE